MTKQRPIYVFDFETDPFQYERIPEPFLVGVYGDGQLFDYYWGEAKDVLDWFVNWLHTIPRGSIVYAHNGGKFDFHFLKDYFDLGDLKIVNARIAKVHIAGVELRDSFMMIPVPLGAYKKDDIEYSKMERNVREKHKEEIIEYLEGDCIYLHELVKAFIDEFGISFTMASAAMKELKKFHEVERLPNDERDKYFRQFYYGGRVEYFEQGTLHGPFKIYDVNSMYPSVMRDCKHPISAGVISYAPHHFAQAVDHLDFATVVGWNYGALPSRGEYGQLDFTREFGEFFVTGHELRMALDLGLFKIKEIKAAYKAQKSATFAEFIDHFYNARMEAKAKGDALHTLFYKLVMNSSYGKFAQNPDNFKDWSIVDDILLGDGWLPEVHFDNGLIIYSRPTTKPLHLFRYNILTAASITGAARAKLMLGLSKAERPVYCDTDSIICEDFRGDLDPKRLGMWSLEAEGDRLAVAGKKMYCLMDGDEPVKTASKGVRLGYQDLLDVAAGGEFEYQNIAPTFSLTKETRFIKRKVRMT